MVKRKLNEPIRVAPVQVRVAPVQVGLQRPEVAAEPDLLLWKLIKESTDNLRFNEFKEVLNLLIRQFESDKSPKVRRSSPLTDMDIYSSLKVIAEAFLVHKSGTFNTETLTEDKYNEALEEIGANPGKVKFDEWAAKNLEAVSKGDHDSYNYTLPYITYIRSKLPNSPLLRWLPSHISGTDSDKLDDDFKKIWNKKFAQPFLVELIWSYWHEQGMLVQTMNAISRRFQNLRSHNKYDPLANMELDPLRPLNNALWGYIQDEQHRLSVVRRAYEYDHQYGLTLDGKAIPPMQPADSRNKFLEAFHHLLNLVSKFYEQANDTTVIADAYPLLPALQNVHMLLSEGAHNQYGDLPTTARSEMLLQQWFLAQPEFLQVLPTRVMVAYPELWMDRVDAMKHLQGWGDISIIHFNRLAVFGEQILLPIRFTLWNEKDDPNLAGAWALAFRSQIQGYIQAYHTVTGVDLTAEVRTDQEQQLFTAQPTSLLAQRMLNSSRPFTISGIGMPAHKNFRQRRGK